MESGRRASRWPIRAGKAPAALLASLALAAPAAGQTFELFSSGLPPTHTFDCNPVSRELCNNPSDSGGWSGVAFGDVDGDGDDDVGANGRLLFGHHVWLSDGAGGWSESSAGLETDCHGRAAVAFADVDGDGHLDLGGVSRINGPPGVWLGDGGGSWSESSTGLGSGDGGEGFTFGDFDGDGEVDLALGGHFSGGVQAWLGDGAGGWREVPAGLPADGGGHAVGSGDLDLDGRDELIDTLSYRVPGGLVAGVHVWSLGDDEVWALRRELPYAQAYGVAVGHLDRDGLPDLAVTTVQDGVGTTGSVWAWLGNADPDALDFAEASTGLPRLSESFEGLALGDMDNDGDLDIVAGTFLGAVRLYLNDGASRWTAAVGTGLPTSIDNVEGLAVGDADADCWLDVAYAGYTCGVQVYHQSNGGCPILADAGPAVSGCGEVTLDGSATRLCGCAPGDERYRWSSAAGVLRDWDPSPEHTFVPSGSITVTLEVRCESDPACVVSDVTRVVGAPDPLPPAAGNVLRAVKAPPGGVRFAWPDLSEVWGDDEIVALASADGPPASAAFEGPAGLVVVSAPAGTLAGDDADGLGVPDDPLVFYRLRSTSPCSGRPGPV